MDVSRQTRRRPAVVEVVAPRPPAAPATSVPRPPGPVAAAIALVVAAGLVLRILVNSPLWLDEALSVNIARLPVPDLLEALRRDGSPPLYYLLLHVWIGWFGSSDAAVRSLSVLCSVATLPLAWVAGRRLAGRTGAWPAVLLLAASPFAIRYASETRMYALLMLLVVGAWLLFTASLVRPAPWRLLALGLVTGLLALTHYWALYLLAAMFLAACWRTRTDDTRPAALRAMAAMAAGGLLFVPWLPSFLFQARHTGTPWGDPGGLRIFRYALEGWSGGRGATGLALSAVLCVLAAVAVVRRTHGRRDVVLVLAWLAVGTLGIAAAAELAVGVSFALRYTAIVFPLFALLAAVGVHRMPGRRAGPALVALATALSLVAAVPNAWHLRTNADAVARALAAGFRPGDVVVYCPDQLGPSISRLLPASIPQVTFPDRAAPDLVNWVDYRSRHLARSPRAFASGISDAAGPGGRVWLVYAWQYRVAGARCTDMADALTVIRSTPTTVVQPDPAAYERARLLRYPPLEP